VFVISQRSASARFHRALQTRNLSIVETAALEIPQVQLDDALAILVMLAEARDPRFDRAAARWVGRLLTERPSGLSDARFALALVERLPSGRDAVWLAAAESRITLNRDADGANARRRVLAACPSSRTRAADGGATTRSARS